jgi:hypothetical protein
MFAPFLFLTARRLRRDRRGAALAGRALAGAAIAGLVAWSVALAERESHRHSVVQAAW